jgi:hypothetical protein
MRDLAAQIAVITLAAGLALPTALAQAPARSTKGGLAGSQDGKVTQRAAATQRRADELARKAQDALKRNDLDAAATTLREQIDVEPESWIPRYNLASTYARLDRVEDAANMLKEAIDHGFFDRRFLLADASMAKVREEATIAPLLVAWPTVLSRQAEHALADLQDKLGPGGEVTRDEDQRVIYLNWADPRSFERAHAELRHLATWTMGTIFAGIADDPAQHDPALDPVVVVALPPRNRFNRWIAARFGDTDKVSMTQVGGAYEHLHVRLVSMDLGSSLRHEFFHAMHWRIANRLGQRHPVWILEGLASLVEDLEGEGANLSPVTSWRTNTAKRMLKVGAGTGLLPLDKFIGLDLQQFNAQRPLAKYAQGRAFFLFLFQEGLLDDFMRVCCLDAAAGYAADASGARALQQVMGSDLAGIDRRFRTWLAALPEVSEEIQSGQASLGVSVESGNGDGVMVVDVPVRGSGVGAGVGVGPLRVGDLILALDGQPTRDIAELIRVLGAMTPGQRVRVSLRREGAEREVLVPLVAKP